jgi:hypothetical protein
MSPTNATDPTTAAIFADNRTDAERATHAEIAARVHANLPTPSADLDSVELIRAMRDEDIRAVEAKYARLEADLFTKSDEEVAAAGRAMLDALGL